MFISTPTYLRKTAISTLRTFLAVRQFATFGKWRLPDLMNDWLEGTPKSATLNRIFSDAYGEDYAQEAAPTSFVSLSDMRCIAEVLGLSKDQVFADLACGRGGPGLWIARETGTSVIGIDVSEQGVLQAERRINDFGLQGRARFEVGTFYNTGLPDASVDGAICIDALGLVLDRQQIIREVARILRPSGRFVLTNWEGNFMAVVRDHRRLLSDNGFDIAAFENIRDSERRQGLVYEGIRNHKDALKKEMGFTAAKVWFEDAKNQKYLNRLRHVLVAGVKKNRLR